MLKGASERGLKSWFAVHRKELLDQTSEKLRLLGVDHGFIASGYPTNSFAPVQLCAIDTLGRRLEECDAPDLIVPDEAHHMVAATWSRCLGGHERAKVVGLTATPERLDGRGLKDHFDELIVGPSVKRLIADGWLSPYRYFAPGVPDLAGVRVLGGDFNRGDIAEVMKDATIIGDVVKHYRDLADGMQGIVFGVDRQHSREIAEAFNDAGISATNVDGSMNPKERRSKVEAFRDGSTRYSQTASFSVKGFDVSLACHTLASLGLRRASPCTFNSAGGLCVCFRASRTPSSAITRAMRCVCPRFPTTTGSGRSKDASAAHGLRTVRPMRFQSASALTATWCRRRRPITARAAASYSLAVRAPPAMRKASSSN
jgi:hypothetical protein